RASTASASASASSCRAIAVAARTSPWSLPRSGSAAVNARRAANRHALSDVTWSPRPRLHAHELQQLLVAPLNRVAVAVGEPVHAEALHRQARRDRAIGDCTLDVPDADR